jgi:hypothetical protein
MPKNTKPSNTAKGGVTSGSKNGNPSSKSGPAGGAKGGKKK